MHSRFWAPWPFWLNPFLLKRLWVVLTSPLNIVHQEHRLLPRRARFALQPPRAPIVPRKLCLRPAPGGRRPVEQPPLMWGPSCMRSFDEPPLPPPCRRHSGAGAGSLRAGCRASSFATSGAGFVVRDGRRQGQAHHHQGAHKLQLSFATWWQGGGLPRHPDGGVRRFGGTPCGARCPSARRPPRHDCGPDRAASGNPCRRRAAAKALRSSSGAIAAGPTCLDCCPSFGDRAEAGDLCLLCAPSSGIDSRPSRWRSSCVAASPFSDAGGLRRVWASCPFISFLRREGLQWELSSMRFGSASRSAMLR